jgi:hypothetical protein
VGCDQYRTTLSEKAKNFFKETQELTELATLSKDVTAFVTGYAKAVKRRAQSATQKSAAKGHVAVGPVNSKVVTELRVWLGTPERQKSINMKSIVRNVCEGDEPVFIPADRLLQPCVEKFVKMSYYEQHCSWVGKHMVKNNLTTASALISRPQVDKAMRESIVAVLGDEILLKDSCSKSFLSWQPTETFMQEIFAVQVSQNIGVHEFIDFCPYGLPECRIVLDGAELIIGFHVDHVPGNSIKDKTTAVASMTAIGAVTLAKSKGFLVEACKGSAVCIPSNHLVIIISLDAKQDVSVLKWSFLTCKAAATNSLKIVTDVMQNSPQVGAGGGYFKQLSDKLTGLLA